MQSNYLKVPSLYNTGFLPNTSQERIKQGLVPQENAGQCESTIGASSCANLRPFHSPSVNYTTHSKNSKPS